MWQQFQKKVSRGLGTFFNTHLPKAVNETNRFFGTVVNAGRQGQRLLSHVHQEVGKSDLFTPQQKARVAKAHAFAGTNLERLSDFQNKTQGFSEGLATFRL